MSLELFISSAIVVVFLMIAIPLCWAVHVVVSGQRDTPDSRRALENVFNVVFHPTKLQKKKQFTELCIMFVVVALCIYFNWMVLPGVLMGVWVGAYGLVWILNGWYKRRFS